MMMMMMMMSRFIKRVINSPQTRKWSSHRVMSHCRPSSCLQLSCLWHLRRYFTDRFSGLSAGVCVCVCPYSNFKLNNFWPRYLACWFTSSSKVRVMGQTSQSFLLKWSVLPRVHRSSSFNKKLLWNCATFCLRIIAIIITNSFVVSFYSCSFQGHGCGNCAYIACYHRQRCAQYRARRQIDPEQQRHAGRLSLSCHRRFTVSMAGKITQAFRVAELSIAVETQRAAG